MRCALVLISMKTQILLLCVKLLMSDERGALAEGFPTVITLVRLLSSVSSPVNSKGGAPAKALPTLSALVRLFSSVESLMFSEG